MTNFCRLLGVLAQHGCMCIRFTNHALERMAMYNLSEAQVLECVENPDLILRGSQNRQIAQKRLNGYLLRVIFEIKNDAYLVITTYKAKRERYAAQV